MKSRLLVTSGLMAMLWPAVASADNWYATGAVGLGAGSELDVGNYFLPDAKVSPESNFRGMLGGGYEFNNRWRAQLDYVFRFNQYGAIANSGPPGNSDMHNDAVTLSAIRDIPFGSVDWYLGAGLGWSKVKYSAMIWNPSAPGGSEGISKDTSGIGGHLLTGLNFQLSPALGADIEYRYFRHGQDTNVAYTGGTAELSPYDSHDLFFGLRYAFLPPAAPPAPPQTPAPAARPSCQDVPFTVYFEWDKSDLTTEARQVVDTAINQLSTCRVATIDVAGHADRSGSAQYNVGLSERRARAVRDEFVSRGIPESEIMIQALGESDPAVDTPDGVREPLNRRAAVVIRVAGGSRSPSGAGPST